MAQLGSGNGTGYPSAIDTATTEVNSPNAGKTIVDANNINDITAAIIAIQNELGIDPAGSAATLLARLAAEHNDDGTHSALTGSSLTINGNINSVGGEVQVDGISRTVPVGSTTPYIATTAPSGWILADGGTIGNASSGGTTRANADTADLFALFWNGMADAQAAVSSGRGATATADFAANKTITISNLMNGSTVVGTGGTAPATHGDNGGAETHTLITAEIAAHTHPQRALLGSAGSGTAIVAPGTNMSSEQNVSATAATGGGGAHNNMPPWVSLSWIIKL